MFLGLCCRDSWGWGIRVLPPDTLQEHRFCSISISSTLSRGRPCVHCAPEAQTKSQMRAKWATSSFIPFSPKQFSEQAFVCPRCFCLCSDLILSINSPHNPVPVYYVPYLSRAWAQQICHDLSYLCTWANTIVPRPCHPAPV